MTTPDPHGAPVPGVPGPGHGSPIEPGLPHESGSPFSEADLSALATRLFQQVPGPDSPPQSVPVAPRGSAPDVSTVTAPGSLGAASAASGAQSPAASGTQSPAASGLPIALDPALLAPRVPGGPSYAAPSYAAPSPAAPSSRGGETPTVPDARAGDTGPVARDAHAGDVRSGDRQSRSSAEDLPRRVHTQPAGWAISEPAAGSITSRHEIFDVDSIRADFPILSEEIDGRRLVWLDNAATTQKPQAVIDRLAYFYAHENSNIHRAAHTLAARATDAYEDARDTVRRFIGSPSEEQVIFVRGTTEAINLVSYAWGDHNISPGDEIVITHLEHHANVVPWLQLVRRTGAVLKVAPVDDSGALLMDDFEALLGPRTKLVAATQVSNALGTVTPVERIVELGHRHGARVLIDGAQSVPHVPVDVAALGVDFFVFSGHKIYGPTGIGALYGSRDALAETRPWQTGGNMIADVTHERAIFQSPPNLYEAGTGNIADAVGLGEALRYVERVGLQRIAAHEHLLLEYATPRLADVPGVRLIGTAPEKASVLSFVLDGRDPVEVGKELNRDGIAVRAGHHCAQPILRRYGLEATVRPSFAFYNTLAEVDSFLSSIRRIAEHSPRR